VKGHAAARLAAEGCTQDRTRHSLAVKDILKELKKKEERVREAKKVQQQESKQNSQTPEESDPGLICFKNQRDHTLSCVGTQICIEHQSRVAALRTAGRLEWKVCNVHS
jgi:hypothetical protein